jgi:hypothetical protein
MREAEPASISDDVIDEVVREINEMQRSVGLDTALRMGRLIVQRFYGGDLSGWRRHQGKEVSFRKLAARTHSDLRLSPTGLYRAVALYELVERLGLRDLRNLSVTHLRLVLGLPEDEQRRLLTRAEEQRWQSSTLEEEAGRLRRRLPKRTGRIPTPPLRRAVRSLAQLSRSAHGIAQDHETLTTLSREEVRALHQALEQTKQELEKVQRLLLAVGSAP